MLSASCLCSPSVGYALAHQIHLVFLWFSSLVGESRLEGSRVLLEKSAEVQRVIRGLHGQIMGFEGRRRRAGARGRGARGVLRGQGRRHTVFSHQDLAEDDGEQKEEKPFGRVRIFSWRLAPDLREDDQGNRSARRREVLPFPPTPDCPLKTLTTRG